MTELTAGAFRTVGPDDAIPDGFFVPFYGIRALPAAQRATLHAVGAAARPGLARRRSPDGDCR